MNLIKKFYFLILIGSLLSGCATQVNNTQKYIKNIDNELAKNYKVEHGHLMAIYDLAKINKNNCIFARDYGAIVNDEKQNSLFIKKFSNRYKSLNNIKNEALVKIIKIKDLAIKINNKYKFLTASELRSMKKPIYSQKTNLVELSHLDKIVDNIPFLLPSHKPTITSHYGMRKHPLKKKMKFHYGIDLVSSKFTPIYSSANGIVSGVERTKTYGNVVVVNHSHNFKTKYAHLKHIDVVEGENVLRGQKIGVQGNTGRSTGEHLHFEIWLNGRHIDPFDFLAHGCKC
jgi:murein DD-endopeptidase MepM/ murein hydrolase activator NlpD